MFFRMYSLDHITLPESFRNKNKDFVQPFGKPKLTIVNYRGVDSAPTGHGCIVVSVYVQASVRGYRCRNIDRDTYTFCKFIVVRDWRAAISKARFFSSLTTEELLRNHW